MSENNAVQNNKQFLVTWSMLNLAGWIIGIVFVSLAHSLFNVTNYEFLVWKTIVVWFPLGVSIGVCQWLELRRFGINLFMWSFTTALGFSILFTLLYGASTLRYDSNLIPHGRMDLGQYIGNIDIGKNISILLGSMGILLGGLITSGLQSILMHGVISRPYLWIRANLFGFLLPVIIMPIAFFFKLIGLNIMYFLGGYFLYEIASALLVIFLIPATSISLSLYTGKLLLKQSAQ